MVMRLVLVLDRIPQTRGGAWGPRSIAKSGTSKLDGKILFISLVLSLSATPRVDYSERISQI